MRDYVREYTFGNYLVRVLVHEWVRGEVRELSSHGGRICHMLILRGGFEEYIERLSGRDIFRHRYPGGVYQSNDSIGDNALRAIRHSLTLEVECQCEYLGVHLECVNEVNQGVDIDSLSSDIDDDYFWSSDDSMLYLGDSDAFDGSGEFF